MRRIQLLLQLYHPDGCTELCFGLNIHLPWLCTKKKERFALGGASSVCRACSALSQTPAPLGMLTKESRAASSSELQKPTDFLPCPLILAQHSSFSCKARKGSKKPRCIIHIHVLQIEKCSMQIFISRINCNVSSTSRKGITTVLQGQHGSEFGV